METHKDIQKKLQEIVEKQLSVAANIIMMSLLLIFVVVSLIILFTEKLSILHQTYIIIVDILILFVVFFINKNRKKKLLAKMKLKNAQGYLRINRINEALKLMTEAYKIKPTESLFNFIFSYSEFIHPSINEQIDAINIEYLKLKKQNKDKYIRILEQIIEANQKIEKYREVIKQSEEKIKMLSEKIQRIDEPDIKSEMNAIIDRYKAISLKSQKDIERLKQKIYGLIRMRYKYILSKEIHKEKEELKRIESQIFDEVFLDEYPSELSHISVSMRKTENKQEKQQPIDQKVDEQ